MYILKEFVDEACSAVQVSNKPDDEESNYEDNSDDDIVDKDFNPDDYEDRESVESSDSSECDEIQELLSNPNVTNKTCSDKLPLSESIRVSL